MSYRITKVNDTKYQFYVDYVEFNMYNDGFNFEDVVIIRVKSSYNKFRSLVYDLNTNEIYWDWSVCNNATNVKYPVIAKSRCNDEVMIKVDDGYWMLKCYETQDERDAITELIETNIEDILETIEEIRAEILLD